MPQGRVEVRQTGHRYWHAWRGELGGLPGSCVVAWGAGGGALMVRVRRGYCPSGEKGEPRAPGLVRDRTGGSCWPGLCRCTTCTCCCCCCCGWLTKLRLLVYAPPCNIRYISMTFCSWPWHFSIQWAPFHAHRNIGEWICQLHKLSILTSFQKLIPR